MARKKNLRSLGMHFVFLYFQSREICCAQLQSRSMAEHLEAKLTVKKTFVTVGGPDAMLQFNQLRRSQSEPVLPSQSLETFDEKLGSGGAFEILLI